jgi:NTE family protein
MLKFLLIKERLIGTYENLDKENKNRIRYFWDGGLLSNRPFRELLRAHEEYWRAVERDNVIPDLEVYIVNLHPSKIDTSHPFQH